MTMGSRMGVGLLSLVAGLGLLAAGCGKSDPSGKTQNTGTSQAAQNKGHDHSEWWCREHGIPEEMCTLCSAEVAAEYKAKGDWCDKHDRAKSQCFICDPKLKDKFAAMYRAKYGKEPPPIEEETDEKK